MADCKTETGARMLELRKKQGKSQSEVAKYLGLTVSAYQNYETGRREAGYEAISKLADFYGVTTDYLLGREPLDNPFAELHIEVKDRPFLESFQALPDYAKEIFIDAMKKMVEAAEKENRK